MRCAFVSSIALQTRSTQFMDAPRSTALIFSLKVWFVSRLCVTAVLRQSEIRFVLIQAYNVQRLYLLQTPQEHYHGDMLTSGDTISEN